MLWFTFILDLTGKDILFPEELEQKVELEENASKVNVSEDNY